MKSAATTTALRSLGDGSPWDYYPATVLAPWGPVGALVALWLLFGGVRVPRVSTFLSSWCVLYFVVSFVSGSASLRFSIESIVAVVLSLIFALAAPPTARHFTWGAAVVLCVADAITNVVQVDGEYGSKESWKESWSKANSVPVVYTVVVLVASLVHGGIAVKLAHRAWYLMAVTSAVGAFTIAQPFSTLSARESLNLQWVCVGGAVVATGVGTCTQVYCQSKKSKAEEQPAPVDDSGRPLEEKLEV